MKGSICFLMLLVSTIGVQTNVNGQNCGFESLDSLEFLALPWIDNNEEFLDLYDSTNAVFQSYPESLTFMTEDLSKRFGFQL